MAITARLTAALSWVQTGAHDLGVPSFKSALQREMIYVDGTAADQADILFADTRTIVSGGTDDLDLAGALSNAFGQTITAAKIVALMISSRSSNTTNLTIGVGTNPVVGWLGGTTPTLGPIRPGGVFLRAETGAAGICSVTAGTADILRIANAAGAAATYDIVILGRSA